MQKIERKKRKSRPGLRWALLAAAAVILAGRLLAARLLQPEPRKPEPSVHPKTLLAQYEPSEVREVRAALRSGETWRLTVLEDGSVRGTDAGGTFEADAGMARRVLAAVCVVEAQETLAEDLSQVGEAPGVFGFDPDRLTLTVEYTDGSRLTLHVGDRGPEESWYYLTREGDPALYCWDTGSVSDVTLEAALLHRVPQPELHQARIDRIRVQSGETVRSWELDAAITDADAADRWMLTEPARYPADGEAVKTLRRNLINLRMGGYAAPDTPENRKRYHLDEPAWVITVHQAAGETLETREDGSTAARAWPEEKLTFTVSPSDNELIDWVAWEGTICTVSHFLVRGVVNTAPEDTLTRYPVLTSLSNLRRLTVEDARGETHVWPVTRTERVAPNNALVTDEQGNVVMDTEVTCDGQAMRRETFEAGYGQLLLVTVSGTLPADWAGSEAEAHTRMVFETETGAVHRLALSPFDALHDAVWLDGSAVFYLVKDGLNWPLLLPEAPAASGGRSRGSAR